MVKDLEVQWHFEIVLAQSLSLYAKILLCVSLKLCCLYVCAVCAYTDIQCAYSSFVNLSLFHARNSW